MITYCVRYLEWYVRLNSWKSDYNQEKIYPWESCKYTYTINSNRLKTTRRERRISYWEARSGQASVVDCTLYTTVMYATMKLLLAVTFVLVLFFTLTSSTHSTDKSASREEKRFLRFDSYKIEAGSIINVPIQCPPDKVKVGNRCRNLF